LLRYKPRQKYHVTCSVYAPIIGVYATNINSNSCLRDYLNNITASTEMNDDESEAERT